MTGPQREDGHLDLANELVRYFCRYRISGQEWQILWVILHKTWGFAVKDNKGNYIKDKKGFILKKKTDKIPLSQFSKLSGIDRRRCYELLNSLINKQVISKHVTQKDDKTIITYGIQKDYTKWKVSPKKVTVTNIDDRVSPILTTKLTPKMTPSKETKKLLKESMSHKKCDAHPDHKKFIEFWHEEYLKQFGVKYSFNGGKDGKLVSQLLKDFEYDRLSKMTLAFFDSTDDWIKNSGFTIGTFKGQANKLAQQLARPRNGSKPQSRRFKPDDDPLGPKLTRTKAEIEA